MSTKRQVLVIARHGDTPNDEDGYSLDSLTDQSVQDMYRQETEKNYVAETTNAFILHSDKDRTITTPQARLAGMRGLTPSPLTQDDLKRFNFDGTLFVRDDRLSYENLVFNFDSTKEGEAQYIEWMLSNRDATELEGKQVTSFQTVYDTRRPVLGDAVRRIDAGGHDVGFISTHGLMSDVIALAAVDSARDAQSTSYDAIGGRFNKEGVAYLLIDTDVKSGKSEASLVRGDLNVPVNLDRIRREY